MRYVHTSADGTEVTEDPLYGLRHRYFNSEVHGMHYGEFANYADAVAQALLENRPCAPDLEEGLEYLDDCGARGPVGHSSGRVAPP